MGTKIGIIGHFAANVPMFDGQTIKTRIFTEELARYFPENQIRTVDTFNWRQNKLALLVKTIWLAAVSSHLIILIAEHGMRIFFPLLYYLNVVFKCRIYHVVIGGDLPELIERHPRWLTYLNSFAGNFAETVSMAKLLCGQGLKNVSVLPNFKRLSILKEEELNDHYQKPFALCMFARVIREKGIEEAIRSVIKVNTEKGETIYTLDIYGLIENDYRESFEKLLVESPDYICYRGVVPFDRSVETIKSYFMLLFPTYWQGEGFPGTLLDAFAAGVPVIASDWRYNAELVTERKEGYLCKVKDVDDLSCKLDWISQNPSEVIEMKVNCIRKACKFHPDRLMKQFVENMRC